MSYLHKWPTIRCRTRREFPNNKMYIIALPPSTGSYIRLFGDMYISTFQRAKSNQYDEKFIRNVDMFIFISYFLDVKISISISRF